jgi:serine/threonine protein kinase
LVQLLHNEKVLEIPFVVRFKIAYQAAKGMHFLHSSGIVHRDLKSLNLLLDTKGNIKVRSKRAEEHV